MAAISVSNLIDVQKLIQDALAAAQKTAKDQFPKIQDVATTCTKQLAVLAADIAEKRASNQISPAERDLLLDLQKNSMRVALLNIEGVTALAVEATINAIINVFVQALNAAVGAGLKLI
jgi:hypothetical protein